MIIKDCIEFTTSAAAFVTALTALWTIREMKMDRKKRSQPHLLILQPTKNYNFLWVPEHDLYHALWEESQLIDKRPGDFSTLPMFSIKNLGIGPAINVKIEWELQGAPLSEVLTQSKVLNKYEPSVTNGYVVFGVMPDLGQFYTEQKCTVELGHCIASATTNFAENLRLPCSIKDNLCLRILSKPKLSKYEQAVLDDIKITVFYEDVERNQYSNKYVIKSKMIYFPDDYGFGDQVVKSLPISDAVIKGNICFKVEEAF